MTGNQPPGTSQKEEVGLIGIGLVGKALAEHLLGAGFRVVGCDIDPGCRAALERMGGIPVARPAEVAERCGRVFLSLMTSAIVAEVVEGPEGLLAAPARLRCIIDTSTGEPEATEALARKLAVRKIGYLDATISGSSQQIREKRGVFMVGGDAEWFVACRDLMSVIAQKVFHVGPVGSGAKAKLATNLILGLNRMALAEGLVFAERLGLDLSSFLELVKETPAYSVAVDVKGRKMLEGDFTPQAKVRQHHKDLTLILEEAQRNGLDLPLARVHREILGRLISEGDGDLDACAVIKALR